MNKMEEINSFKPPIQTEFSFGKKEESIEKETDGLLEKAKDFSGTLERKDKNTGKKRREVNINIRQEEKKESHEILWGPAYYQLPGKYHSIGSSERARVYFGSDLCWYVDGVKSNDDYAWKLIKDDEDDEDYDKIIKKIQEIKDRIKK